jgi:hypothetical protein
LRRARDRLRLIFHHLRRDGDRDGPRIITNDVARSAAAGLDRIFFSGDRRMRSLFRMGGGDIDDSLGPRDRAAAAKNFTA